MSSTTISLAVKPWARDGKEDSPLGEVLGRVNHERGQHFRDLTEASLQEEAAAEGALSQSTSDDEDEEDGEDARTDAKEKKQPTTRQELFAARQELLQRVTEAQQDILLSLDMISLLETKHNPSAAGVTVSAVLKQSVPMASIGTDVWERMPVDKAREAQDNLLASNVRMKYLQEGADDLLAAASRLQDNVRKETRFWDEILAVSERGWNVSRVPAQKQRLLGVHFGFNGSAPEFAKRNLAALITDPEGGIKLERGVGTKPKAVRVIVRKSGDIVGATQLPTLLDSSETSLEGRIRHARDSVYDEELYHEMIREARTLTSMGVLVKGSDISFATTTSEEALEVSFRLVSLDEDTSLPTGTAHDLDHLAQAALLTARLLLGEAHREKLRRRTRIPPPLVEKKDQQDILPILRPLLLLAKHHSSILQLNSYVANVDKILRQTQSKAVCEQAKMALPTKQDGSLDAASLIGSLLRTNTAEATIKLDQSSSGLKLAVVTSANISLGSSYYITDLSGSQHELSYVDDLTAASDELLAAALTESLRAELGTSWTFDSRAGCLFKNTSNDAREAVQVALNGLESSLELKYSKGSEQKQARWSSKMDEKRRMREALETLLK